MQHTNTHRFADDLLPQELPRAPREGLVRVLTAADARNVQPAQADRLGWRRAVGPVHSHDDHRVSGRDLLHHAGFELRHRLRGGGCCHGSLLIFWERLGA